MNATQAETTPDQDIRNKAPVEKLPTAKHAHLPAGEITVVDGRNDRCIFDDQPLLQLGESMAELGQVNEVIVNEVRGRYELVAGERRLRALLSRDDGESRLIECKVYEDLTPLQIHRIVRAENGLREPLNVIERAASLEKLTDLGLTDAQIAAEEHCSTDTVRRLRSLLELPAEVQTMMIRARNALPIHQARLLLKLPEGRRESMARKVAPIDGPVATEEQVRAMVNAEIGGELPFATGDAPREPDAGDDETPRREELEQKALDTEIWELGVPVIVETALREHDPAITTVRELQAWQNKKGAHWATDIKGLGTSGRAKIEDALETLWTEAGLVTASKATAQAGEDGTAGTDAHDKPNPKNIPNPVQKTEDEKRAASSGEDGGVELQDTLRPVKTVIAVSGKLHGSKRNGACIKKAVVTVRVGDQTTVLPDVVDIRAIPGLAEAVDMAAKAQAKKAKNVSESKKGGK